MQFIALPFGDNPLIGALLALGVVLVLIVLGVWLLKLVFSASTNIGRGRQRRLDVVETMALDQKRQLVIVRRDGVEHLLLVGGAQDVVIEAGILVEETQAAAPGRRPVATPPASRRSAPAVVPPVVPPAPAATPLPAGPATVIEKLRESGKATDRKQHLSLRHTGLLRPVSDTEPSLSPENVANTGRPAVDSAKEDEARRQGESGSLEHNGGQTR